MATNQITTPNTTTKYKYGKYIRVSNEIYKYLSSKGTVKDSYSDVLEKILKKELEKG